MKIKFFVVFIFFVCSCSAVRISEKETICFATEIEWFYKTYYRLPNNINEFEDYEKEMMKSYCYDVVDSDSFCYEAGTSIIYVFKNGIKREISTRNSVSLSCLDRAKNNISFYPNCVKIIEKNEEKILFTINNYWSDSLIALSSLNPCIIDEDNNMIMNDVKKLEIERMIYEIQEKSTYNQCRTAIVRIKKDSEKFEYIYKSNNDNAYESMVQFICDSISEFVRNTPGINEIVVPIKTVYYCSDSITSPCH